MNAVALDRTKFEKARGGRDLAETAKTLGITYQHLWAIEKGTKKPSIELLTKMCQIYEVPINYFFSTENFLGKV